MANEQNLKNFTLGNDPRRNLSGRPKGARNRSTIVREILEMVAVIPDATYEQIKTVLPDIEKVLTAEQVLTLSVLSNAIAKGDGYLYSQIMDSAYGKPKQDVELESKSLITIEIK